MRPPRQTATFWNPNLCDPLQIPFFRPLISIFLLLILYVAIQVSILKVISAFRLLIKEPLFRSATVIYLLRVTQVRPVMKFDPTPH